MNKQGDPHAITGIDGRPYRVVWYDTRLKTTVRGVARLERTKANLVAKEMNELFEGDVLCSTEPVIE